jgi:hypothetical protein
MGFTWEELVPGTEGFWFEKFGGVVGGESLVDFEGSDLSWDCCGLVLVC